MNNTMNTKTKESKNLDNSTKILIYNGKAEYKRYLEFLKNLEPKVTALRDAFNTNFQKVYNKERPFNRELFAGMIYSQANLKQVCQNYIEKQEPALKEYYSKHFQPLVEQTSKSFESIYNFIDRRNRNSGYNLPTLAIEPKHIPFKDGTIDYTPNDEYAKLFNTYVEGKEQLEFYEIMKTIAEGFNDLKLMTKNTELRNELVGILPMFLETDDNDTIVVAPLNFNVLVSN